MTKFSDYIVYADESGSPTLTGIDANYPIFVLVLLIIKKEVYCDQVVPAIQRLKMDFFGHDQIIIHERDIRKQQDVFKLFRTDAMLRNSFLGAITKTVMAIDVSPYCVVIDKRKLNEKYNQPFDPYQIAVHLGLEGVLGFLRRNGQEGRLQHILFETRGANEDRVLGTQFDLIVNEQAHWGSRQQPFRLLSWERVFTSKKSNSAGLQLADLIARPVGTHYLNPGQPNRAFDAIASKIPTDGLKRFP